MIKCDIAVGKNNTSYTEDALKPLLLGVSLHRHYCWDPSKQMLTNRRTEFGRISTMSNPWLQPIRRRDERISLFQTYDKRQNKFTDGCAVSIVNHCAQTIH